MDRDIDVNGVRLHCVVEGEGPLVLLLHGFPETSHAWRKQMPALAERYRVVAPDLRGFGASDKPKGIASYRASVVADDIAALIRGLGAGVRTSLGTIGVAGSPGHWRACTPRWSIGSRC